VNSNLKSSIDGSYITTDVDVLLLTNTTWMPWFYTSIERSRNSNVRSFTDPASWLIKSLSQFSLTFKLWYVHMVC